MGSAKEVKCHLPPSRTQVAAGSELLIFLRNQTQTLHPRNLDKIISVNNNARLGSS